MKTKNAVLTTLIVALCMMVSTRGFAQKEKVEIKIQTSAQCSMCKDRIEGAFAYETGIKKATLDLTTKILTVVYNPNKTDDKKIRLILNNLGYDADDTKANQTAYDKLPPCCKKPDASKKN